MGEYAASWSGGKDSCLACWKAMSRGLKVSYLLNFVNKDSTRAMSHGLDAGILSLQAQAMQLPIIQQRVTWEAYEGGFKDERKELKSKGVNGLINGEIYREQNKDWRDRVCGEAGMEAVLPLWGMDTAQLLTDFIDDGFKATVVSVKTEILGKEWLGRQVDGKLAAELRQLNVDPCGEAGEFHTFVYDGPLFRKPIKIINSSSVLRDEHWFLDIAEYSLG